MRPHSIKVFSASGCIGMGHELRTRALTDALERDYSIPCKWAFDSTRALVHLRDLPPFLSAPRGECLTIDIIDTPWEKRADADLSFGCFDFEPRLGLFPYAIIRPELRTPMVAPHKDLLLVSLGGVDPTHSSDRVAYFLSSYPLVVQDRGTLRCNFPSQQRTYAQTLHRAKVLVCSMGMTVLEGGYAGAHVIALAHNDRENERGYYMASLGLSWFRYLGLARYTPGREIADAVSQAWWHAGPGPEPSPRTVDGSGLERIVAEIVDRLP